MANLENLDVSIISAREFCQLESKEISDLAGRYDLFWMATRPTLQVSILKKIIKIQCNVILEKPLATTSMDWGEITELLQVSECRIFFSQPWTFSKLWECAANEFSEMDFPISIEISRTGEEFRSDFTALQDWLPHDLFLIENLIQRFSISGQQISVLRTQESNDLQINVGTQLFIKVCFTVDGQREMIWKVSSDHEAIFVINFMNSSFQKIGNTEILFQKFFPGDNPLVNMFNQYIVELACEATNYLPIMQAAVASNFQDVNIGISR